MAMRPHMITQGEYLTRLAVELGFDPDAVWNHPRNDALRARRPNRDVLAPGDVLWVPDAPPPRHPLPAGQLSRFRAALPSVTVTLVLRDGDAPLADEPYAVWGDGVPDRKGRSDGDGRVELQVSVRVREVFVSVPRRGVRYRVAVGHLDPVDDGEGARQRLRALGYDGLQSAVLAQPDDGPTEDERDAEATRRFQAARGLEVTGAIDDATRDALTDAYGS